MNAIKVLWAAALLSIAAFIVFLAFMWSEANAACTTVNKVKSDIETGIPGAKMVEMGGSEAKAFIAAFNAYPPETQFTTDYIVTIQDTRKPNVALVLFENGCFSRLLFLTTDKFNTIMGGI